MTSTRHPPQLPLAVSLLLMIFTLGGVGACSRANVDEDGRPIERFKFRSYEEVGPLLERFNYTPEAWEAGVREVPRIYLTNIPTRWRDNVASEVSVRNKKRIFFRTMAPLVLRANELVLSDRERLASLASQAAAGRSISGDDRDWLGKTAVLYRVAKDPGSFESDVEFQGALDELLVRVDIVPVSLVLAQCAEESGWGTSRFAAEGNALFGQWTWSDEGITPQGQRKELGDYRVASFETPLQAVMAYMVNLNSHPAYTELRTRRAAMRFAGERISGRELAITLTSYSERGQEYVTTLHDIMRVNQLDPADDAYLGDTPTIYLIPVGKGSK